MARASASGFAGLPTCPSCPSRRACSRSCGVAYAVTAMAGNRGSSLPLLLGAVVESVNMPGRRQAADRAAVLEPSDSSAGNGAPDHVAPPDQAPCGTHRGRTPVSRIPLSALAKEAFVLPPRDVVPVFHDAVLRLCREAGFIPHTPHEADHLQMIVAMIASGAGVGLVPTTARKFTHHRVAYRPIDPLPDDLEISIVWPARRRIAERVRIRCRGTTCTCACEEPQIVRMAARH